MFLIYIYVHCTVLLRDLFIGHSCLCGLLTVRSFVLYTPCVFVETPGQPVSGRVQCTGNPDNHTFCNADGRPKSAPVAHRSRYLYVSSILVFDYIVFICTFWEVLCLCVSLSSCLAGDLLLSFCNIWICFWFEIILKVDYWALLLCLFFVLVIRDR